MQPSDNTYKMMANSPSASQQQRAQQQQQMVQAAVRMQQSPQQQQQYDRQQRQQMMLNQSYAPNQQAMASSHMHSMMLTSSQDHTTSPMAFRWPPTMQQPSQQQLQQGGQTGDSIFGNMNFSADLFNDTSQADAEIEAILSNYQPRPYSNVPVDGAVRGVSLPDSTLSSQPRSSQMMHQNSLPSSSSSASMGGMRHDHVDPINSAATAAAAAYSHLGYGGGSYRMDDSQSSGTSEIDQKDNRIKVNGASHPLRHGYSGAAGERTIAYDGDASNTSSSHTPGGASSGEDSMGGKRRRMTVGGIEAVQQQTRYEAGLSTGGADGKGAAVSQASGGKGGRPIMQHHGTSTVDSRSLEKMAQHSLKQAGKDNARAHTLNLSANPNRPTPNRPAFRHRRSHSGSNVPIASSSTSTVTLQNAHNVNASQGGSVAPTKRLSGPLNTGPQSASSMQQRSASGYAAAQSLSNGDQVQRRPVDMTPIGSSAATDFTKRKGWPTRIVEELLDFVHVLDREGRVLFASPSVLTLTGWRAEELTGKPLTDFVHQDDVSSVQFEFQRSLQERSEMTMYYRFRRKPQTAADKQRVREQREAQQTTRSRSGSASGGDSSSNQEANKASTFATGSFDNAYITGKMESLEEEGELTDDLPDKYVIFEATGHPYISPHGSFPEAEPMGEKIVEQILPKLAANHLASQSSSDKSDVQPKDSIDGSDDEIQCFFCSCRVYPTKNVGMLDSFLELKLENERLRMLLSEMSVSDGPARQGGGDAGSDGRRSLDESQIGYHLDYMHELEQQHQQQSDATPNRQRNSLGHGTSSFPPPFHVTETMTGNEVQNALARKGSISQSVHDSSNPVSPTLNRSFDKPTNDGAGEESDDLASPNANSTAEEKRRKKKVKPEEGDYVCTDCGRVDSPEWRKGPLGPKTLCNACGLRWAKKVKRSGGDPNAIAMAARPAKGQIKAQAAAARAQKQNLQFQQENGDATQTGPPPLSSNPGVGLLYSSQTSPSQFSTSFSHLYDDGSMNHMSGHEFLNSAAMRLDPSMQQHHQQQGGHPNYSPYQ